MESDNVDIRDDYFHNTDEFSGTFAAHSKNEGGIDAEEVARRIEEAKAEALRMAADDHKAQMDALEETVRQSVEAEKAAALEALRIEHDEKARNLEDEVIQRAENEKVAALEAQRAEHESHMEAELLKSQEVLENEKMAALAAQQAEHESNAQRLEEELAEAQNALKQETVTGPDLTRLMIYSSDTPDIDDFAQMVKCQKARYEFDTDSADRLLAIIDEAVAANDGQKLKSIALACHGPPPDADGDIDESEAAAGAA
jgi:hypothetical protein